ncbi:hypothetical protein CL656_02060 [bacterium]|nr:hypothetical protein [bacterium]|tara:strand:- start:47 stop:1354 length:1308 start_codon:yes stop_codon:yes gene_type:complete
MFYISALLLPIFFNLSLTLAIVWVLIFLIVNKKFNLELFLILLLLIRCFMFLDTQNLIIGSQFDVCREVFNYRNYNLVFLCNSKDSFISYFPKNSEVKYSDEVYLIGGKYKFDPERKPYYKSLNVNGVLEFNDYKVLTSKLTFLGEIYNFKANFKNFVQRNLNDPLSNLFLGILIGDRSGYSKFLTEDLRYVGLTHLVAVSGMNVLLVLEILKKITWIFGRRFAFYLNAIFIIFFAYFTSLTTSVLRACLMALLNLWGEYNFLRLDSLKVLYFSAYALLLINPYFIVYDLSYALSFLATFALISVKKTEKIVNNFKLEIQANLVSFWFTLPVILFAFKSLPILTVFSNLLVMIPATLILYLGLLLLVSYLLNFELLSFVIFFLIDLFTTYFFWIVDFTKKFPVMTLFIDNFMFRIILFLFFCTIFYIFLRKKFIF